MKMETYQKLSHPAKTFLRGKFKVINTYIKKKERSQTTYLYISRKWKRKNKLNRRK